MTDDAVCTEFTLNWFFGSSVTDATLEVNRDDGGFGETRIPERLLGFGTHTLEWRVCDLGGLMSRETIVLRYQRFGLWRSTNSVTVANCLPTAC